MKNLLTGLMVIAFCFAVTGAAIAGGKLETYKYIAADTSSVNNNATNDLYSEDLNRVELYLYHKIYPKQSITTRLGRIERTIFRQTYPSMTYSERVNNILSCYQNTYNMKNYVAGYYSPNPFRRIYNRYYGYPTGLTPPVIQPVFDSSSLPSYNNSYYNNRGYSYNHLSRPSAGIGVHILD